MWLSYALMAAGFSAVYGLEQKRLAGRAHLLNISFAIRLWTLPVLLIALLVIKWPTHINQAYWLFVSISSILTALGTYLSFVAYRLTNLSVAFPFLNFTPAFGLLAAWFILRDLPSAVGLVGIGLIIVGSFWLVGGGLQSARSRGALAMLGTAGLFGISSAVDKLGIAAASPIVWTLGVNLGMTVIFGILLMLKSARPKRRGGSKPVARLTILAGAATALTMLFQMLALGAGGHVAYVLAIKQLGAILAVAFGLVILKERLTLKRLVGALIMTAGAAVIGLGKN